MKRIALIVMGAILLLSVNAQAYKDGDFQVWNTESEEFQINKDAKIAFEQEFRWGGSAKEFYYQHYDVGFFYNLQKHLNVGAGYRHVLSQSKGKYLVENEPYITATFLQDLVGLKFEDRSRLEYNHFDHRDDTWRYRNKFTIKSSRKFTKFEIQPYLSDEIFILFDDGQRLSQNRFSAGLGVSITKNLKAEIYYMLVSVKSAKWLDANVLGTKVKLVF